MAMDEDQRTWSIDEFDPIAYLSNQREGLIEEITDLQATLEDWKLEVCAMRFGEVSA